jgi:hypothetical protein
MRNHIKTASISLAILLATSAASLAKYDPLAEDRTSHPISLVTEMNKQNKGAIPQIEENKETRSLFSTIGGYAWSGAQVIGNASYNMAWNVGNNLTRYGVAYGASYLGIEALMEGTALGVYCGAYALGGPVPASVAYNVTRTTFTVLGYVPGIQGALAATYMPLVRPFTDMAIDNAPMIASTGYSIATSGVSLAYRGFSSLASWVSA